ncbi:MAG TPA: FKBP-type peptidyl-prolyl cis-trans isomerase [Solirubrobacterales bacterium]|nr:FKBP-type peptidyl-prolyl cis-trans isomerase [Solirubrobacterales bacterium]
MQRLILSIGALLVLALAVGCGGESSSDSTAQQFRIPVPPGHTIRREDEMKVAQSGLSGPEPKPIIPQGDPPRYLAIADLLDGIGHIYEEGDEIAVQYVAYDYETGKKFASSWDEGKPLAFTLGQGETIDGWEEGLIGAEGGDRREMVVPPDETGGPFPQPMPDGATVVFVVDPLPRNGAGKGKQASSPKPAKKPETKGSEAKTKPKVKVPSGPPPKKLEIKDLEEGTGPAAKAGDEVTVQYVGVNYKTGQQFDASWDRGEPFTFKLGEGLVIQGWEQGIEGMKAGGRRELIIPPQLGYGSQSTGTIPANETLVFVVDLEAIG